MPPRGTSHKGYREAPSDTAVLLLVHAAGGRSNSGAVGCRGGGDDGTRGGTTATGGGAAAGGGLLGYGGGRLPNGSHLSSFSFSCFSSSNLSSVFSVSTEAGKGREVLIHNPA